MALPDSLANHLSIHLSRSKQVETTDNGLGSIQYLAEPRHSIDDTNLKDLSGISKIKLM